MRAGGRPVPAFRVERPFRRHHLARHGSPTSARSCKEESPTGAGRRARRRASAPWPGRCRARSRRTCWRRRRSCPTGKRDRRPRRERLRLRLRIQGASLAGDDLQGAGPDASPATSSRSVTQRDAQPGRARSGGRAATCAPSRSSRATRPRSWPRPGSAVAGRPDDPRAQAERLVRHVNALLEKKPTVSLPSAREVLRTRVGDCNEHTALYVAMARAARHPGARRRRPGLPARRLLLPRLAGGLRRGSRGPRALAARGPDPQPVPGRRHPRPPRPRRPRPAGRDPAADRTARDRPSSTSRCDPGSSPDPGRPQGARTRARPSLALPARDGGPAAAGRARSAERR